MYFFVDFQEFKTFNQRPPTFGGPTQNKKSQNLNFMQLTDRYSYSLNIHSLLRLCDFSFPGKLA